MIKYITAKLVLAGAVCALVPFAAFPDRATAAAAATKKPADATRSSGMPIEYAQLEQHVGDEVIVETTLDTVRRGTLVKYTNPTLTLQLGPEHGSIQLSVPHDSVRSLRVIPAAEPPAAGPDAAQEQGKSSAEKN